MADFTEELIATAKKIATPGRGILAADESTGTIGKRLSSINQENTEDNRRNYRELLFTTKGLGEYVSGVILYDETIRQSTRDGKRFVDCLLEQGIVPGIKVDEGVKPLFGTKEETTTQGLDNLDKRCKEYYNMGARFAKWRAVLKIDDGCPSELSIHENAYGLARYARICQDNGLVPIVEPEILMDGSHDIRRCAFETERVLAAVYKALNDHHVLLEGTLLKPNMVLPGADCPQKAGPGDVAFFTIRTLRRSVPAAVPSINFLSGGLSEENASVFLNAMNQPEFERPWSVSFSYGRALQQSVLKAWLGQDANVPAAQAKLLERAKANSEAVLGKYKGSTGANASESLYEKNYKY